MAPSVERPSSLTQALIEVGRINKTRYVLNYIENADYRRRILTQRKRGEGRHALARAIGYGQRGEIRKRYREGPEDQLDALGFVTNAVVLWNMMYMQAALAHVHHQAVAVRAEDVARLSPLLYRHINVLGQYAFILDQRIRQGTLRPLNHL